MLFFNFVCLFYLMVLINSHTISKSIASLKRIDDTSDSLADLDYSSYEKRRRDVFLHKYKRDEDDVTSSRATSPATVTATTAEPRVKLQQGVKKHAPIKKGTKRKTDELKNFKVKKKKHNEARIRNRNKIRRKSRKEKGFTADSPDYFAGYKDKFLYKRNVNDTITNYTSTSTLAPNITSTRYSFPANNQRYTSSYTFTDENIKKTLAEMTDRVADLKSKYNPDTYKTSTAINLMTSLFIPTYSIYNKLDYTTMKPMSDTESTFDDSEFVGTAQIETLLNDIKARAYQMIAEQNPSVAGLVSNTVTETTFEADPMINHIAITKPSYAFTTLVSASNMEDQFKRTLNDFDVVYIPLSQSRNESNRSIRDVSNSHTARSFQEVEDALQHELKEIYEKLKKKMLKDKKIMTSTPIKSSSNATVKPAHAIHGNHAAHASKTSSLFRRTRRLSTTESKPKEEEPEKTSQMDDYAMLSLFEQILTKTHEDNVMKMLTTAPYDVDVNVKNDEANIFEDKNSDNDYGGSNAEVPNVTYPFPCGNPSTEPNPGDLSEKLSYKNYVNGYKYYLDFQKEQARQNFSNQVKFQAHKHHKVDDIGKFILNKIPPMPTKARRNIFDDSDMEYPDITTKSDDSWFKRHFYMYIDTGPPKKYHTAEAVTLKSVTDPKDSALAPDNMDSLDYVTTDIKYDKMTMKDDNYTFLDKDYTKEEKGSSGFSFNKINPFKLTNEIVLDKQVAPDPPGHDKGLRMEEGGIVFKICHVNDTKPKTSKKEVEEKTNTAKVYDDDENKGRSRRHLEEDFGRDPRLRFTKQAKAKYKKKMKTKDDSYVNLDVLPPSTAIVNLYNSNKKEGHKMKKLFKKFKIFKRKKKNKVKAVTKREIRRPERFNPFKKIKAIFRNKIDDEKISVTDTNDYDLIHAHIDTFKPVKFNPLPSPDELKYQVPNISGDDIKYNEVTTSEPSIEKNFMLNELQMELPFTEFNLSKPELQTHDKYYEIKDFTPDRPQTVFKIIKNLGFKMPSNNDMTTTEASMEPSNYNTPSTVDRVGDVNSVTNIYNISNQNLDKQKEKPPIVYQPRMNKKKPHSGDRLININLKNFRENPNPTAADQTMMSNLLKEINKIDNKISQLDKAKPNKLRNAAGLDNINIRVITRHKILDKHRFDKANGLVNASYNFRRNVDPDSNQSALTLFQDYTARETKSTSTITDYFNDLMLWHSDILNNYSIPKVTWYDFIRNVKVPKGSPVTTNLDDPNVFQNNVLIDSNEMNNLNNFKPLDHSFKLHGGLRKGDKTIGKMDDYRALTYYNYKYNWNYRDANHATKSTITLYTPIVMVTKPDSRKSSNMSALTRLVTMTKPATTTTKQYRKCPTAVTKTYKKPKQTFITPLPMALEEFDQFLKRNGLDVESVTSPLYEMSTLADTWSRLYTKDTNTFKNSFTNNTLKFISAIDTTPKTTTAVQITPKAKNRERPAYKKSDQEIDRSYPEEQIEYLDQQIDYLDKELYDYRSDPYSLRKKRFDFEDFSTNSTFNFDNNDINEDLKATTPYESLAHNNLGNLSKRYNSNENVRVTIINLDDMSLVPLDKLTADTIEDTEKAIVLSAITPQMLSKINKTTTTTTRQTMTASEETTVKEEPKDYSSLGEQIKTRFGINVNNNQVMKISGHGYKYKVWIGPPNNLEQANPKSDKHVTDYYDDDLLMSLPGNKKQFVWPKTKPEGSDQLRTTTVRAGFSKNNESLKPNEFKNRISRAARLLKSRKSSTVSPTKATKEKNALKKSDKKNKPKSKSKKEKKKRLFIDSDKEKNVMTTIREKETGQSRSDENNSTKLTKEQSLITTTNSSTIPTTTLPSESAVTAHLTRITFDFVPEDTTTGDDNGTESTEPSPTDGKLSKLKSIFMKTKNYTKPTTSDSLADNLEDMYIEKIPMDENIYYEMATVTEYMKVFNNSLPKQMKRHAVKENCYTAKDVAAIEVVVDLMKNEINPDMEVFGNSNPQAKETVNIGYKTKKTEKTTNSIQVRIAIPVDVPSKKRAIDGEPLRVRKVFSAKLASPVDLEYQIHTIEVPDTLISTPKATPRTTIITTPLPTISTIPSIPTISMTTLKPTTDFNGTSTVYLSADQEISPGMYILLSRMPNGSLSLRPVSSASSKLSTPTTEADLFTNPSPFANTTNKNKFEMNKEFIEAINEYLLLLYDNLTASGQKKVVRRDTKDGYWTRFKSYFGHDRVCNGKCKENETVCSVCAASEEVMKELMIEFENLSQYMINHCTEIQTFFWMNPRTGKKLKDLVHKIDKTLNDYYKRTKGKCRGKNCNAFNTFLDKRGLSNNSFSSNITHDGNTVTKHKFDDALKTEADKFINAARDCIAKTTIKRSITESADTTEPSVRPNRNRVYSLDNINVNIICDPESSYKKEMKPITTTETIILPSFTDYFDYTTAKTLKSIKSKFYKNPFSYYVQKNNAKRSLDNDDRDLIADAGGSFWHDYMRKTREDVLPHRTAKTRANDTTKMDKVSHKYIKTSKPKRYDYSYTTLKHSLKNKIKQLYTKSTGNDTVKEKRTTPNNPKTSPIATKNMDTMSINIQKLMNIYGSDQVVENYKKTMAPAKITRKTSTKTGITKKNKLKVTITLHPPVAITNTKGITTKVLISPNSTCTKMVQTKPTTKTTITPAKKPPVEIVSHSKTTKRQSLLGKIKTVTMDNLFFHKTFKPTYIKVLKTSTVDYTNAMDMTSPDFDYTTNSPHNRNNTDKSSKNPTIIIIDDNDTVKKKKKSSDDYEKKSFFKSIIYFTRNPKPRPEHKNGTRKLLNKGE